MMSDLLNMRSATAALLAATMVVGCGGGGGGGSTARNEAGATATIVLSNGAAASSALLPAARSNGHNGGGHGGGRVDISDILSLTVTVSEIYFQYCGHESGDDVPDVVLVGESDFTPPSITIEKGESVRWKWTTDTGHTITSGEPDDPDAGALFDEEASGTGSIVELTFPDAGSYPYFSDTEADVNAGMSGVVHVEDEDEDCDDGDSHHGNGDDDDRSLRSGGGHGDDDHDHDDDAGRVIVYSGNFDVNLLDLTALSEVLTTAQIPAARYSGIRLTISNPRLVLVDDPSTVITNVRLTANGRLFVKEHFQITEEDELLITLDFGGIHLVRAGNSGQYVLTPKLKADVQVTNAATSAEGEIVSIDAVNQIIQVQTDTETLDVGIDGSTLITSDDDSDDAADTGTEVTLVFGDLAVGQRVTVQGLRTIAGPVDANAIQVADDGIDTTI